MKKGFRQAAAAFSAAAVFLSLVPVREPAEAAAKHPVRTECAVPLPVLKAVPGTADVIGPALVYGTEANAEGESGSFPSEYDMRKDYPVTAVRNQSGYGTCWAHSSIASAESGMADRIPGIDLSEFHTAYFTYSGGDQIDNDGAELNRILNTGGNTSLAVNLWSQWIGPVKESRMPYGDLSKFSDEEALNELKNTADYHMRNAWQFDYDLEHTNEAEINAMIKQFVMEGKAVDASFYSNDATLFSRSHNCTRSARPRRAANHAVLIVGWDDEFPAEYFISKPERNGAWLVKNSWGYNFGDCGYMWISYDEKALSDFAVYELEDKDVYDINNHHDTFLPTQRMSAHDSDVTDAPSYMANIFESPEDQTIEAVATYFSDPGTEYEIKVYTGLKDAADPASGTLSGVTKGTMEGTGYFTVDLDAPVSAEKGSSFSVVMKMYDPDDAYVIPIESSLFIVREDGEIDDISSYSTKEKIAGYTGKGESFFSADGVEWSDTANELNEYSESDEEEILEQLKYELFYGAETAEDKENAQKMYDDFCERFAAGELKMTVGNIALKALGRRTNAVHYSLPEGAVSNGAALELTAGAGETIYYSINRGEWQEYKGAITITEPTEIKARTSSGAVTSHSYYPSRANIDDLVVWYIDEDGSEHFVHPRWDGADRCTAEVSAGYTELRVMPVSRSEVRYGGELLENGILSLPVEIGEKGGELKLTAHKDGYPDGETVLEILTDRGYEMGDADMNGYVDASDATDILMHYSDLSVGGTGTLREEGKKYADMDENGVIDASDATLVLKRYAELSTA